MRFGIGAAAVATIEERLFGHLTCGREAAQQCAIAQMAIVPVPGSAWLATNKLRRNVVATVTSTPNS